MSVTRLPNGKYRIDFRLPEDALGRRQRVIKVIDGSKRDAELYESQLRVEHDPYAVMQTDMTLGEYLNRWIDGLDLAPQTVYGYRNHAVQVTREIGHIELKKLSPYALEKFFSGIEAQGQRLNVYKTLSVALKRAYRLGFTEINPIDRVERPRPAPKQTIEVLDVSDVTRLLEAVRGHLVEPVVLVMIFGGFRPEEACGLEWRHVNFKFEPYLDIVQAHTTIAGHGSLGELKTKSSKRQVPISEYPAARLKAIMEDREIVGGPVALDAKGDMLQTDEAAKAYKKSSWRSQGCPLYNSKSPPHLRHAHAREWR